VWHFGDTYRHKPILVKLTYHDPLGHEHTETVTINPDETLGQVKDKNANVLNYNCQFEHKIKQIQTLSLSVQLSESETLPLMIESQVDENHYLDAIPLHDPGNDSAISLDEPILVTDFQHRRMMYMMGAPDLDTHTVVQFQDISKGSQAPWVEFHSVRVTSQGFVVEITSLPIGNYPLKFNSVQTEFRISYAQDDFVNAYRVYPSEPFKPKPAGFYRPKHDKTYDVWHHPITESDSYGNTVVNEFHKLGGIESMTLPAVPVITETGEVIVSQSKTYHGYNTDALETTHTNADGGVSGHIYDDDGHPIQDIDEEGTVSYLRYFDGFGRAYCFYNGSNKPWIRHFSALDQITMLISPVGDIFVYGYNGADMRNLVRNPDGSCYLYNSDARGNVSALYLPMGQEYKMTYGRHHETLTVINPSDPHHPYFFYLLTVLLYHILIYIYNRLNL